MVQHRPLPHLLKLSFSALIALNLLACDALGPTITAESPNANPGENTDQNPDTTPPDDGEPEENDTPPTDNEPPGDEPTPPPSEPGDSDPVERTYPFTKGPDSNPHKGWSTNWSRNFPEATVGMQYIPWSAWEPEPDTFDTDSVEAILERPGSTGRHLIIRLYCDWRGDTAASQGCPAWLYEDPYNLERLEGDNGTYITDYNSNTFIERSVAAIDALAAQYNEDPRLHAMQIGILGYRGEWTTTGSSLDGQPYEITDQTQIQILDAFREAFDKTPLMARFPSKEPAQSYGGLGFYNDGFLPNDEATDNFNDAISAFSHWRNGPISGEVPARTETQAASDRAALFNDNTGAALIRRGHYTTVQLGYRITEQEEDHDTYLSLHRLMGYNFQIESASFPDEASSGDSLSLMLSGRNIGVAPFYFEWQTQLALLDATDTPVHSKNLNVDLRELQPDTPFQLSAELVLDNLPTGDYRLALRIIQPDADAVKAEPWKLAPRNTYIEFANEMPEVIAGQWDADNRLIGGWSVLGDVSVVE